MKPSQQHLSRRTVLRGIGTCLALAMLDAMSPALAGPGSAIEPQRLIAIQTNQGILPKCFFPTGAGKLFVQGSRQEVEAQVAKLRSGRSILDSVGERARQLGRRLGPSDREKESRIPAGPGMFKGSIGKWMRCRHGNETRLEKSQLRVAVGGVENNDSYFWCRST